METLRKQIILELSNINNNDEDKTLGRMGWSLNTIQTQAQTQTQSKLQEPDDYSDVPF